MVLNLMDTKHIEGVEEAHEEVKSAQGIRKTFAGMAGAREDHDGEIHEEDSPKNPELTAKPETLVVNAAGIPEKLGEDGERVRVKQEEEVGAAVEQLMKTETKLDDLRMMSESEDLNELMARAKAEREELMTANSRLQKEIQQFWETDRRSRIELKDQKLTGKSTDILYEQNANYLKNLEAIKSLVQNIERKKHENRTKIERMEASLGTLDRRAQTINQAFKTFKREIAAGSVNQQTGKQLKPKRTLALESAEAAKDKEVEGIRLTNIHHVNKLSKLISQVRKKEELADGLHMIDFEQLKVDTYRQ